MCATNNSAPVLLYYNPCFFQEWGMVVMKYLGTAKTLEDNIQNSSLKLSTKEKGLICQDVSNAIRLFHNNKYVFGNLRATNIVITNSLDSRRYQAQLIDFDRVGQEDIDKYPNLNPHIDWPDGVGGGMLMKKDHDLIWLERLGRKLEFLSEVEML
ncbi:hypothetical protein G9A89_006007 [Geosiphon pyriformis]|nr:hypothetical protein G9A89_006007 [Geosiphon pyriformis]